MTKTDWTKEKVRHAAAQDYIPEVVSKMLTAYANRIEADESAVPYGWVNLLGEVRPVRRGEGDIPVFTHPPAQPSQHDLYKRGDINIPSVIKDRNGDIVLALCKVCGRGEAELDEPCTTKKPSQEQPGWKVPDALVTASAEQRESLQRVVQTMKDWRAGENVNTDTFNAAIDVAIHLLAASPTPPKEN